MFLKVYECTIFVNYYQDWTKLELWIWIRTLLFFCSFYTFISVAWLEITGADQTSKIERFDYFREELHLEWLNSSSYATVYLTTFSHVVFSGVTITSISEVGFFPNILNGFYPLIVSAKGLCLSSCFALSVSLIIILVLLLLLSLFYYNYYYYYCYYYYYYYYHDFYY